jgi:hypothetical protein
MASVEREPGAKQQRGGGNPRERPGPWLWAEAGPGVPCCEAQADGFPCPELRPDCSECAREMLLTEGWSGRLGPWVPLEKLV